MNAYLIIGISSGLGRVLFQKYSKDNLTFAITSKKELVNKKIAFYSLDKNIDDQRDKLANIENMLSNFKNHKFNIILNSAIYDKKDDNIEDKKNILNINYFNQISIYEFLVNKVKIKVSKIIFFSSFEALKKYSNMQYYRLSKIMYIAQYHHFIKNPNSPIVKLFILGGIKTDSYNKNTKIKKSIITKYLPKDVETAALFVIKKIKTNKSEIIYYPKYYYYLNIVKNIIS